MGRHLELSEVVAVLPYVRGKVLMQLRDAKQGIAFPGCWGFFGGSVDEGETPEDAVRRELIEELECTPRAIHSLNTARIRGSSEFVSHSFFFRLSEGRQRLMLNEGMDLGLFSYDEILSKRLYSRRFRRSFPVAATLYIPHMLRMLVNRVQRRFEKK